MPNIVVLVKQVPDTNAKIVVNGDRVDLSSVKMVMSPYDEFAVEIALKHKEAGGGEVTALTVGGAGAEKILKDAIAEEDKRKPLSDEKLGVLLNAKGYNIARRTVAKYREQLGLPVARLRKEL